MKLKDTGLTAADIKAKVKKYMIETYERFDFLAETAKDQYMYDENSTAYLDFYAGIAVNSAGNEYAKLAVFAANAVVSVLRRADTRSWITLPDGQQVWEDGAMAPGAYQVGVSVNGRTVAVPVELAADETALVWIADCGTVFKTGVTKL